MCEQGDCVEGAGGLVFVTKGDEDLASAGELAIVRGEGGELRGGVAAGATQAEAGVGGGGVDFRGCKIARVVAGVGDAESRVVLPEQIEDGLLEPGGMSELKGDARRGRAGERGKAEEVSQEGGVGLEVWRQLEEERPESAGGGDRRECGEELVDVGRGIAQTAEVGNALGCLEGEAEVRRGCGEPAIEHLWRGQSAERVVDFDRREAGAVEGEEVPLGEASRVEARLPGRIGPAGGANKEIGDRRDIAHRQARERGFRRWGTRPDQETSSRA